MAWHVVLRHLATPPPLPTPLRPRLGSWDPQIACTRHSRLSCQCVRFLFLRPLFSRRPGVLASQPPRSPWAPGAQQCANARRSNTWRYDCGDLSRLRAAASGAVSPPLGPWPSGWGIGPRGWGLRARALRAIFSFGRCHARARPPPGIFAPSREWAGSRRRARPTSRPPSSGRSRTMAPKPPGQSDAGAAGGGWVAARERLRFLGWAPLVGPEHGPRTGALGRAPSSGRLAALQGAQCLKLLAPQRQGNIGQRAVIAPSSAMPDSIICIVAV